MKFLAPLALFAAVAAAMPALDDKLITARVAHNAHAGVVSRGCSVPSTPDKGVIDTVYRICKGRGIPAKALLATFMTMRVESNYHNLNCGDKDSAGVFQQRPSVGAWGSYDEVTNVPHATNAFLDALMRCYNNDSGGSAGQLAQCAQRSERPFAYDQAADNAREQLNLAVQRNGGGGGGGDGGAGNVGSNPSNGGSSLSGCKQSHKVVGGDTCKKLISLGGGSLSNLRSLNSNINSGCTNLVVGKTYCLKKGTTSSSKPPATSGKPTAGCKTHRTVKSGDTCSKLAGIGGIALSKFYSLNSGKVNSACTNLKVGESVCIN